MANINTNTNTNSNTNKSFSYSSILKGDEKPEVIVKPVDNNDYKVYNFEEDLIRVIKNLPERKDIVDWLLIMPDTNKYHFDYCENMFKILKGWMEKKNFTSNVSDDVLFAKFISILFLTSNKKGYNS